MSDIGQAPPFQNVEDAERAAAEDPCAGQSVGASQRALHESVRDMVSQTSWQMQDLLDASLQQMQTSLEERMEARMVQHLQESSKQSMRRLCAHGRLRTSPPLHTRHNHPSPSEGICLQSSPRCPSTAQRASVARAAGSVALLIATMCHCVS
eukprot:GHVU01100195.1.p1 GENE.GHVU01100195.1~~GHVU01100195.1.p1  ORF type:complete len:152 (+),score=14.22 GHVU01100195.1:283-738(+)